MILPDHRPIVIAGAGSVGGYVGGCLALAGQSVTLLARPGLVERLAGKGLRVSDLRGLDRQMPLGPTLRADSDPQSALAGAGLILVTVKGGDTEGMADLIARHAPGDAIIVSLQNGIGNAERLAARLGTGRVIAGMVPFNIVQLPDGHFHRGTDGQMLVAAGCAGLADRLNVPGLPVADHADMASVLWGKLLLNLNNALNALSGLPLAQQIGDRAWRRILAAQQREGLAALARAGIRPARLATVSPHLLPFILCLPDPLFRLVARRMLSIDPLARSSMWEDLERRRSTEIDRLQGAVIDLAARHGLSAPICARVRDLVRMAEQSAQGSPCAAAHHVWLGERTL